MITMMPSREAKIQQTESGATELLAHEIWVPPTMTYGSLTVTGHCSQQETLNFKQGHTEEDLGPTAFQRDGFPARQEVDRLLGHSGADDHEVHEGELAEEEVHGCVQLGIQVDEQNHGRVPLTGYCEDGEDRCEEEGVGGAVTEDFQQEKVKVKSLVSPSHPG